MAVDCRLAVPDDHLDVLRVLDAAMLETDVDVRNCIENGTVLVAADERADAVGAVGAVGALVAEERERGARVDAIAVRQRRRDQGIGSLLVTRAAERWRPLTVEFDERVKPFYDSLGFTIERDGDRYQGTLD